MEDRLQQLQANLSLINADRDNLTASLKSSRKDAQKADAALRSEIEVLKRASEKHAVAEHRARQKVLALQEAVKRAQTATKEVEGLVREVEAALPGLRIQRDEKEEEYAKVKEEVDRAQRDWDKESEKDKKRIEAVTGEMTVLGNKLERLNSKKDKLEGSIISDLEEQLREVEQELRKVEADPFGYKMLSDTEGGTGHDSEASGLIHSEETSDQISRPGSHLPSPFQLPVQRQRHQGQLSLGAIARPSLAPIQRPSSLNPQPWAPNPAIHNNARPPLHVHAHNNNTSPTFHAHRPLLPKSSTHPVPGPTLVQHPYPGTVSPGSATPAQASTLSSWTPAFEPNSNTAHAGAMRPINLSSAVETSASASYSVPIHRPRQSISGPSRAVRGSSK
jgi:hypothetical protein